MIAASAPITSAQTGMACHPVETQEATPPTQLPPPRKMTGIGNGHMQISANAEAQMWFDQGLNLLHDFWDYESARAFEQAIRVDPHCAMCYWGLYKAESFYHSIAKGYADQALAQAVKLENDASKRERLYIQATAAEAGGIKQHPQNGDSSQALVLWRKLVRKYPNETQAQLFLAQVVSRAERQLILQQILKKKPDDSAANHYYIHLVEPSEHPEQALHSAEILASLAPESGHMVHMPGHIFFRIGDYARAERAFAASMQVDERYLREQHIDPDNDWNYVHNLMYSVANLLEEGKLIEATAISAKLSGARGKLESTLYVYSTRDSVTRLNPELPVALRTADWARILELLKGTGATGHPHLDFLARQLTTFTVSMQAIEIRDLSKAEESSREFDAELWRASQEPDKAAQTVLGGSPKLEVRPDAVLEPIVDSLAVMSLELRASILALNSRVEEAKHLFEEAARREKRLGYHEPPGYIRPVGETEGAVMLAIGEWNEARNAYERALKERPRSGFALYGIAISGEKAGNAREAVKKYADFLAAWKDADSSLQQLSHARRYVAGQGS